MHLYVPHISVVLLLITFAAIIMDGGFPASIRTSRALQTVAMVWAFWILYVVTEQIIR